MLVEQVEAGDGDIELAESDELRHVLRPDDLHFEAVDAGVGASDVGLLLVAIEADAGFGQRFVDVALLVAVGHGEAERVTAFARRCAALRTFVMRSKR